MSMDGLPQRSKSTEEQKVGLEVQHKSGYFRFIRFEADVLIDSENNITFTKDVDAKDSSMMSEIDLRELIDAGILVKGNSSNLKSNYKLAGDGYGGLVHIDKDEINNAIKAGRLKLGLDSDGEIGIL